MFIFITANFILSCQMDSNRDGLVDFNEFVAATLHVHQLEEHDSEKWQQLSRAAFEKFDFDKDGYITPEELRMVRISCNHCWVFFEFFL
jgi:Ca2+-binding EF-hand superfamily protein